MKNLIILIFICFGLSCTKNDSSIIDDNTDSDSLNNQCFNIEPDYSKEYGLINKWIFLGFTNAETGSEECKPDSIDDIVLVFGHNSYYSTNDLCNLTYGNYNVTNLDSNIFYTAHSTPLILSCKSDIGEQWYNRYTSSLSQIVSYSITGDRLNLTTNTATNLVFQYDHNILKDSSCFNFETGTQDYGLIGTWNFLGYIDTTSSTVYNCKPEELGEMYVSFEDSSKFSGKSSCNQLSDGHYKIVNNDSLIIENFIITFKLCFPALIQDWESIFVSSLFAAKRFNINGNKLTIVSSTNYTLIFRRE